MSIEEKTAAGSMRRSIPDDYSYNPKKLKHLKSILHNVSVALGTLSSALNEFAKLKGPDISPDGLLGGVGYIIPVADIKQSLTTAVHSLSNVADCIADELTNPRWNAHEDKEVKELIKEKEKAVDKVEEHVSPEGPVPEDDVTPNDVVTVNEIEDMMAPKQANVNDILAKAVTAKLTRKQSKE